MNDSIPRTLADNPILSTWIDVGLDGKVELRVGKVELGQGILTALTLIAANELGVNADSIKINATNTDDSPDEGLTSGSKSIQDSGSSVRHVCAVVRHLFLQAAALRAGLSPTDITVAGGSFLDPSGNRIASYGGLAPEVDLDVRIDEIDFEPKFNVESPLVELRRIDLPDKIFGRPRFIHDLTFAGMLHARIVRPPAPGAHLTDAAIDDAKEMAGVRMVMVEGDFLAVVAEREGQADRAASFLATKTSWTKSAILPDQAELSNWLKAQPVETNVIRSDGAVHRATDESKTLTATYSRPFIAHASIAPSCAIAKFDGQRLEVWSSSQGIFWLRSAIAKALELAEENVVIQHVESSGSYGHNGSDDAAFDAALLATRMPHSPIRVQWSRADELSWDPFGPAMVSDLNATLDHDGNVTDWSSEVWSNGHAGRPGYSDSHDLLSDAHLHGISELPPSIDPPAAGGFGTSRNAIPGYGFARMNVTENRLLNMPIRASALRSLGAHHNVFAIESFMDELAQAAGKDPLEFRLAHLRDPRAIEVLTTAASAATWDKPLPSDVGRGIAYARYKNRSAYCAVVAEVEAEASVRVKRLTIAVDVGRIISADGARNQIEGGAIQATSWTIHEQVRFDSERIISSDWESYPILRFSEAPRVDVSLISRPDEPSLGAGEAAQGPVTAAIGNALFDLLGLRLRNLPFTSANVVAAI